LFIIKIKSIFALWLKNTPIHTNLFDMSIPDYHKAISIINSCTTLEQLVYAERYVKLFKDKYGKTDDFFDVLDNCLFSKKMALKNGWNNKD